MKQPTEAPPPAAKGLSLFWWAVIALAALLTFGQAERKGWSDVIGNPLDTSLYEAGR